MHQFISETAKWGDLLSGPRVINRKVKTEMEGVLKDIQSGKFARVWIRENKTGKKKYTKLLNKDLAHPIEKVGRELRARMPGLEQSR